MSKWIIGKEIIEKNGINTLELLKRVTTGLLQPHDRNYHPVPPPDVQQKKNELKECERDLEHIEIMLPFSQPDAPSIPFELPTFVAGMGPIDLMRSRAAKAAAIKVYWERPESFEKLQEQKKSLGETVAVLKRELSKVQNSSWEDYWPEAENINLVFNYLKNSLFKRSEVEKIINQHDHANKEQPSKESKNVFPCKPGTTWSNVEITRISYDAVIIETQEGKGRYNYTDLKMKDGRIGDMPTKSWKLLMYFCEFSGRITSETQIYDIKNLSKAISDLNKKLQDIFGINENFCHRYNQREGWVAKCKFNDQIESE